LSVAVWPDWKKFRPLDNFFKHISQNYPQYGLNFALF
jgi:hypothetical protein